MKIVYALMLSLALITSVHAQDDDYVIAVKECIVSNGTMAYYDTVLEAMVEDIKTEFSSHTIPDNVWESVAREKEFAKNGLAIMLSQAYKTYFTLEDIEQMNGLYTSKAGRNMLQKKTLSKEEVKTLDAFYNSAVGQKIQATQSDMSASLRRLAKIWINNTSNKMVTVLSEQGYSL